MVLPSRERVGPLSLSVLLEPSLYLDVPHPFRLRWVHLLELSDHVGHVPSPLVLSRCVSVVVRDLLGTPNQPSSKSGLVLCL